MKTLIIIPSRLAATRLPGKPLFKINGLSIISHVFNKAVDANIGEVYVAAEDQEIIDDVNHNGGQAILTSNNHMTGTDRIYEALKKIKKSDVELVINLQGDEPLMSIEDIRNLHNQMIKTKSKIGTLGSKITNKNLYDQHNVVKVITKESLENSEFPDAINFMRTSKNISKNIYHHLGVYCYQAETLEKFVSLQQSSNEIKNKLEQLRALDNDIKINVSLAKKSSIGVDTEEDFVAVKKIMEYKSE
jgi:3-deoxy-manno-octulosonate cytidylyltransferase (CMP-KDO synthetase)